MVPLFTGRLRCIRSLGSRDRAPSCWVDLILRGLLLGTALLLANPAQSAPAAPTPVVDFATPTPLKRQHSTAPPAASLPTIDPAAIERVTEHGKAREVIGEVVEIGCFLRRGARGQGHRACALSCSRRGAPLGIVEDKTDLLYLAALEAPATDTRTLLEDHLAARVRIQGRVHERAGTRVLLIEELERLSSP